MYYYIINPTAGKGAINALQERLKSNLESLGIAGEFVKTTGPGDATLLATKAIKAGYNTIVAVGGDETVNEVINGINSPNVAVGIIPIGHSNKLAHQLGILDWQSAGPILAGRRLTEYSLIAAGQNVFLSDLHLGFETDLDKKLDTKPTSKLTAQLGQFTRSLGHARSFSTLSATIKVDDDYELTCNIFSLTVSNQKFHDPTGTNKMLISVASQPNRRQLATYLWQRSRKNFSDEHIDTQFYARKIIIETEPTTGIMIDGKVSGRTPIAIRLTDRKVRFICGKPKTAFRPSEA